MKVFFKVVLVICFVFFIGLGQWAQAKDPAPKGGVKEPFKIGIVDMQRILSTSKVAKGVRDDFLKEVEAKRKELLVKAQEVQKLEQELANLDPKATGEERREKQEKLKRQNRELNNLRQDIDEELKRRDREVTQKLIGEILATIRSFAQSEHYMLILERSSIEVAEESLDITDKIIKLYDSKKK
jgi:outer membrane protein